MLALTCRGGTLLPSCREGGLAFAQFSVPSPTLPSPLFYNLDAAVA